MLHYLASKKYLIYGLLIASAISVVLFICSAIISHSLDYDFLLWNLFLAWIPLLLSTRLVYVLKYKLWSSWEALILSYLWILFLPNSFYMISDFIHLQTVSVSNVIYYAATFSSIIYTAVVVGFISLYMVHIEIMKRFSRQLANIIVLAILISCSYAIYIGRDLRLTSWDVFINPFTVIFDISNRLIHISNYPSILATSGVFFLVLASMYILALSGIKVIKSQRV